MAYDTQIDLHLASNALEPALMFASEYYFRNAGRCCQAEGFRPDNPYYPVQSVAPGPLWLQSLVFYQAHVTRRLYRWRYSCWSIFFVVTD
jgi:hypothetical protein